MAIRNKVTDYSTLPESVLGKFPKDEEDSLALYVALERASQIFSRELAKTIRENRLTPPQFGVLGTLMHSGPATLSSLGERLLVTAGNITCVVDKLEDMTLVKRERDKHDRRIIIAELTKNGEQMINTLFPSYVKRIAELSSDLKDKEKKDLTELLRKLSKSVPDNR